MPDNNHIFINKIKFLPYNQLGAAMINNFVCNSKLQRIFSVFDKDGNGKLDMQNANGVNEVLNVWNTMLDYAGRNGDNIFDSNEVYDFIRDFRINKNVPQSEHVGVSDVTQFIANMFRKDPNSISNTPPADLMQEVSLDELRDLAVISLVDDVGRAREIFDVQVRSQGSVSDFVNFCKEIWDTDQAASKINRYLMCEEFCASSLTQAMSDDGLTKKAYLEGKIDLLISMLPQIKENAYISTAVKNFFTIGSFSFVGGQTRSDQDSLETELEIEMLRDSLRYLTPQQLIGLTERVAGFSDDEYAEKASQILETLLLPQIEKYGSVGVFREQELPELFSDTVFTPGTIGALEQFELVDQQLSFEETFLAERGVEYDPEAIADYQTKNAEMQIIAAYNNQLVQIERRLSSPLAVVADGSTYISDINRLSTNLSAVFRMIYGNDAQKIQAKINELMGEENDYGILSVGGFGEEFLMLDPEKFGPVDLVELAQRLQSQLEDNYQILLGGKSFDERREELSNAYAYAYGAKNAQRAADAFVESQDRGVQNVRTTVNTVGTVLVIAGQCVPGLGQATAAALIWGGTAISTFSGAAISTIEGATREGGLTPDDKEQILLELSTSIALLAAGRGIGRVSETTFKNLILNNCPKLLAWITEVGVDAGLSLLSTYAITGELDLRGEGFAQLQQVLVGILGAKARGAKGGLQGGFKSYLNSRVASVQMSNRNLSQTELQLHLKNNLHYDDAVAIKCAEEYGRKPEIQDKLMQIVSDPNLRSFQVSALLKYANSSNIDDLLRLYRNKSLYYLKPDGDCNMAGLNHVLTCLDAHPQYRTQLLDIATNTQRPHQDIVAASELMQRYPNRCNEISELLSSNQNIKVGYDVNHNPVVQIDDIMTAIDVNPQFKNEIMDYMKVQRRANNDTTDPTAQLGVFLRTLSEFPEQREFIMDLSKNHNLEADDISEIMSALNNGSTVIRAEDANTIRLLSSRNYTREGMVRALRGMHKYPQMEAFLNSERPSYRLIDPNPDNTPSNIRSKRSAIKDNLQNVAPNELEKLRRTLGDDYYNKVCWEEIIPDGASPAQVRQILDDLNFNSKFFARTVVNENRYGKNIQWASQMGNIANCASSMIRDGASFDNVIHYIASDYRAQDEATTFNSNNDVDRRRSESGISRENPDKGWKDATTGTADYVEYEDRFNAIAGQRRMHGDIDLTCIAFGQMYHPDRKNIEPAMDIMRQRYEELTPLFNKVANNRELSPSEISSAHEKISEIYFLMANVMPWNRGSNGISDVFMRSMYKSLGIDQPAVKRGVSLDLEAFTMDMNEYKQKWNNFFEDV